MANTTERGRPGGIVPVGQEPNAFEVETLDYNGELRFPLNIPIYDRVRTDGQIESVLNAVQLPILSAKWDLLTDGVKPEIVALIRTELGLTEPGAGQSGRQRRHGIVWRDHLEQALTMLWAGFMCFEQVYEVGPPAPDQQDLGLDDVVHLRKLAPRLPQTITRIATGRDGGLKYVAQVADNAQKEIRIPVEQLVFYCRKREGADWSGKSILRTAYKNWLIKDALLRLDAQAAERNSMGIPVIYYTDESQEEKALQIATNLRAGATAGVALKRGEMEIEIKGVQGSTVDLLPKINYHDQQMAKSALAMFLDLGHDNGARSLGETHLSVFLASLQHTAEYIADVATEHIIRDLVEHNFGPDEAYPLLTPGSLKANQGLGVEALKMLVDAGVVRTDDKLEEFARTEYGLPEADAETARELNPAEPAMARVSVVSGPAAEPVPAATETEAHTERLRDLLQEVMTTRDRVDAKKAGAHDVPGL